MISIIIVGLDCWEKYTLPMIESIKEHDPGLNIVCVDNGSQIPYPRVNGISIVRNGRRGSYAEGLNIGLHHAPQSDWYIAANNDLVIYKCISDRIVDLSPDTLYGFLIYDNIFSMPYMPGWFLLISNKMYQNIGEFDQRFSPMWFEDADYCFRVIRAGYSLEALDRKDWGVAHLEDERMGERKGYMAKYMEARHKNRTYLRLKHGL